MKPQTIINAAFAIAIGTLFFMTLRDKPGSNNSDAMYNHQTEKNKEQVDTLKSTIKKRKDEITKDSTSILNADRRTRDSLRAIYNSAVRH